VPCTSIFFALLSGGGGWNVEGKKDRFSFLKKV